MTDTQKSESRIARYQLAVALLFGGLLTNAADVWVTLQAWVVESNPLVLGLGVGPWLAVKAVLLGGLVACWWVGREHRAAPVVLVGPLLVGLFGLLGNASASGWHATGIGRSALGAVAVSLLVVVIGAVGMETIGQIVPALRRPEITKGNKFKSAALSILILSSAVVGVASVGDPLSPVGLSEAASSEIILTDGFEDGDLSGWTGDTATYQVVQGSAPEGNSKVRHENTDASDTIRRNFGQNTTVGNVSIMVNMSNPSTSDLGVTLLGENNKVISALRVTNGAGASNTIIHYYAQGEATDTGITVPDSNYAIWRIEDISYSTNTFDLALYHPNGTLIDRSQGLAFQDSSTYSREIKITDQGYTFGLDYLKVGGKSVGPVTPPGSIVNGTITNPSGDSYGGATVELVNESGTEIANDTTASNGTYSLSGVSDGDYTLRVKSDDYQTETRSVTVNGSSVTVDVRLGYVQTVELNDPRGIFQPYDPKITVYRWDKVDIPTSSPSTGNGWTETQSRTISWDGDVDLGMADGEFYALELTVDHSTEANGSAEATIFGYVGNRSAGTLTWDVSEPEADSDSPVVATVSQDTARVVYDGPPVEELNYSVRDGNETLERNLSFDEPRSYFDGQVQLGNTGENISDPESVSYSGVYANGSTFNGSSDFQAATLSFGPVSGGGGGGPPVSPLIATTGIAAVGVLIYSRSSGRSLGELASGAADAVRGLTGRGR